MTLLEFVPQCCDASIYLKMGQVCAEQGNCNNGFRPMGAVYWFSLPYRFGLPPTSLILGHYLLLAISVILSVIAGKDIRRKTFGVENSPFTLILFTAGSLLVHLFFLLPVLRTSLSDAPAGLLALIGTWLLLLQPEKNRSRIVIMGLGGLSLGLAAWLRAFYLYPVLLGMALWLIFTPWRQKSAAINFAVLCGIIPIALQYAATFNASKKFSYLNSEVSSNWSMVHLDSTITGYDTILPFDYHTWYAPCDEYASIYQAINTLDIRSMACLLAGRIHFYLGSYSIHPYLPPFEHAQAEEIKTLFDTETNTFFSAAQYLNFFDHTAAEIRPQNEAGLISPAMAKRFSKLQKDADAELTFTLKLERGKTYRFEIMAWSDKDAHDIRLDLTDPHQKNIASSGQLFTPTLYSINHPRQASLTARIDQTGEFQMTISSRILSEDSWQMTAAKSHGITEVNQGDFYIWDIKLAKTAYHEPTSRKWSSVLMIINLLALSATIFFCAITLLRKNHSATITCSIPFVCLFLSLCIVPEQRFTIYPQIFLGWCAFNLICIKINSLKKYRQT